MILKLQFFLLISVLSLAISTQEFYAALSSSSVSRIEKAIEKLENSKTNSLNNAYLGALRMKKSSFMKTVSEKVEIFKQGHKLLEKEIKANPKNTEYRFLRLSVQENAPKILRYNKNLEEDKQQILKNYASLHSDLRKAIRDYAKQSNILQSQDLK